MCVNGIDLILRYSKEKTTVKQGRLSWLAALSGLALALALMLALQALVWAAPAPSEDYAGTAVESTPVPEADSPTVRWAVDADYPNCRLGVGIQFNAITQYDYTPLRLGWYVDWHARTSPVRPSGMDYYHTIWEKQDRSGQAYLPTYSISPTLDFGPGGLGPMVQANPGSVWMVGNEPDRVISQGDTMPDMYAEIYHDVYYFIKGIDPTAKVAIGAVVQPTPIRLQYLDLVLDAYQTRYGSSMPVDVWNTHLYIIAEERGKPGAEIPPGIGVSTGRLYTAQDHLDITVFMSLIAELRTWMRERGYQNKPLIITEFGALLPLWYLDDFGFTQDDIDNFIADAISYMNSATVANLGYPADNYRLVQQAALYSLDDDSVFSSLSSAEAAINLSQHYLRGHDGAFDALSPSEVPYRWGSFLFHSAPPYTRTATGDHYAGFAATLPASVDLLPYRSFTDPGALIVSGGGTVSPTLKVAVSNAGNSTPPISVTVRFLDVTDGQGDQVGSDIAVASFTGCGTLREAEVIWPNLSPGLHSIRIEVDPDNLIQENLESNNVMTGTVLVGTYGTYLPVVLQ
jgi:hypothetical protein